MVNRVERGFLRPLRLRAVVGRRPGRAGAEGLPRMRLGVTGPRPRRCTYPVRHHPVQHMVSAYAAPSFLRPASSSSGGWPWDLSEVVAKWELRAKTSR